VYFKNTRKKNTKNLTEKLNSMCKGARSIN